MASLTAHLVETGDHGRLGFHPTCPVCRQERLLGSLSSDAVISRRAQAALASGVLALSAVVPSAALAQESDHQLEGGSGTGQDEGASDTGSGPADVPGSDPGARTGPPSGVIPPAAPEVDPVAPPEEGGDLEEVVPVEIEPVERPGTLSEPESRTAPGEADPDAPPPETAPGPVAPDSTAESPVLLQPPSDLETPDATDDAKPAPPGDQPSDDTRPKETIETDSTDRPALAPTQGREVPPAAPIAPPPSTGAAPAAAEPLPAGSSSDAAQNVEAPSSSEDGLLVVQSGDSLWAIAKRLLGPDASPAQIARKVTRLWELNADRIGTGSPDLLMVGTKLRVR